MNHSIQRRRRLRSVRWHAANWVWISHWSRPGRSYGSNPAYRIAWCESLCHIEDAHEVLNVGCGIGAGLAYLARKFGCHVIGVDISEKMIQWSRQHAREERVEDKVEFRVADVLELPFEADRFDVVLVESVLGFVEDKPRAIRECVRATRPGGYVGLNEAFWIKEQSPEVVARVRASVGTEIPTSAT